MISGFAEAFAAIRDELKTRITQKVHAAGVMVPEDDIAQIQNVILWMTIDPELQEMLLVTALAPADGESRGVPWLDNIRCESGGTHERGREYPGGATAV